MTIGIDIDDTLTKTTKIANMYLKKDKDFNDVKDYHLLSKQRYILFINRYLEKIEQEAQLHEHAKDTIDHWKSLGHKVVIITARGSKSLDCAIPITDEYLKNNNINIDEIYYCQERKGEACQKAKVDIFIDDKESVLDEIKKKGIITLRFCSKDKISRHDTVDSWDMVKEYIERLGKND